VLGPVEELQRAGKDDELPRARVAALDAGTAAAPPIPGLLVAPLAQQIEDDLRTPVLSRPHVLTDRLRVENAPAALGEENQAENLIFLA